MKQLRLSQIQYIFSITVFLTILSNLPILRSGVFEVCYKFMWLVTLYLIFLKGDGRLKCSHFFKEFALCMGIFWVMQFVVGAIFQRNVAQYISLIKIPVLVCLVSGNLDKTKNKTDNIDIFVYSYLAGAFVIAIDACFTMITNFGIWLESDMNIYASGKNSVGQILAIAVIVVLFYIKANNRYVNIVKYIYLMISLIGISFVQARASILSLIIVCIYSLLGKKNLKWKLIWIVCIVALIIVISGNSTAVDIFNHIFRIDKYSDASGLDIERFSSGRTAHISRTLKEWFNNGFLLGLGPAYYVDNFYVSAVAQTGLLMAPFLFYPYLKRVYLNFKAKKGNDEEIKFIKLMKLISIFYLVESFFEGFPPYGPGVATLFFWAGGTFVDLKVSRKGQI